MSVGENEVPKVSLSWVILELMGHRKLAGRISEEVFAGVPLVRLDTPTEHGGYTTQFYSAQSVYCITPVTEELARRYALANRPCPVSEWDLRRRLEAGVVEPGDEDVDDEF